MQLVSILGTDQLIFYARNNPEDARVKTNGFAPLY